MKTNFVTHLIVLKSALYGISIKLGNSIGSISLFSYMHQVGNTSRGMATVAVKARGLTPFIYYGEELISGGFYVPKGKTPKPDDTTWVPVRNLLDILQG